LIHNTKQQHNLRVAMGDAPILKRIVLCMLVVVASLLRV
jgi:hypothetical protein